MPARGGPTSLSSPQAQLGAAGGEGRGAQDPPFQPSPWGVQAQPALPGSPLAGHSPSLLSSPLPQLFSLQAPLKTLLQLTIMPIINGKQPPARSGWTGAGARCSLRLLPAERTRKGVQIPLPEGMDFTREVVTNHAVREHGWDSPDPVAGTGTVPGGAQAQAAPG